MIFFFFWKKKYCRSIDDLSNQMKKDSNFFYIWIKKKQWNTYIHTHPIEWIITNKLKWKNCNNLNCKVRKREEREREGEREKIEPNSSGIWNCVCVCVCSGIEYNGGKEFFFHTHPKKKQYLFDIRVCITATTITTTDCYFFFFSLSYAFFLLLYHKNFFFGYIQKMVVVILGEGGEKGGEELLK